MSRRLILLLLLSVLSAGFPAHAQTEDAVSEAQENQAGPERIAELVAEVDSLRTSEPYRALEAGLEALTLLQQYPDPVAEVSIRNEMSWANRVVGDHTEALNLAEQSLAIAQANGNLPGAARALNNIGVVYFYLGDNEQALDYWLQSLAVREEIGEARGIAGSLNNIGLLYIRQKEHRSAIEYLNRALDISQTNGNAEYSLNHLDNLGEAYASLGEFDTAENYYLSALQLAASPDMREGRVSVLVNLGALELDRNNMMAAESYLNEGRQLAADMGGRSKEAEAGYYLAKLYQQQNRANEAISVGESALTIAKQLGEKHLVRDLHQTLASLYEDTGALKDALWHIKLHTRLQEQLFDSERQNKMALLQTRFEMAESQKEIALLTKDRAIQALEIESAKASARIWQSSLIAAATLCLALFLAFRSRTRSRSRLAMIADNYNHLLRSLPLGVLALDDEGEVRFANEALDTITQQSDEALSRLKQQVSQMRSQERTVEEWSLPIQGEPPRQLLLVVKDRFDDAGQQSGYWLLATDLTEQKATNAQLIQASKLATLGEMSTGMAHELNQPLNVIALAVANLSMAVNKGKADDNAVLTKLGKIKAAVDRASHIIDHMRAYGRVADVGLSSLDVGEVIACACDLMAAQLKLANVRLDTQSVQPGLFVKGNAIQLEQVLLNLINNARDAIVETGDAGGITISAERLKKRVQITVRDTGGGIPEHALPHIFEPFFTTKPVGKGTGLGGSISYGIIRDMQGDMWAENVNEGAQITITLPESSPNAD